MKYIISAPRCIKNRFSTLSQCLRSLKLIGANRCHQCYPRGLLWHAAIPFQTHPPPSSSRLGHLLESFKKILQSEFPGINTVNMPALLLPQHIQGLLLFRCYTLRKFAYFWSACCAYFILPCLWLASCLYIFLRRRFKRSVKCGCLVTASRSSSLWMGSWAVAEYPSFATQ